MTTASSSPTGRVTLQSCMLLLCLVSVASCQSHTHRRGRNLTIHSSQLVCSLPGPQGSARQPGASGSPGAMGAQGPPGRDGLDGKDGEQGDRGAAAEPGRPGNPGKPGPKGKAGVIGKAGPRGFNGLRGTPGGATPRSAGLSASSRILLNEGDHYNATSGRFVGAVPGPYYFTYDITLAHRHLAVGLVHNGNYKIETFDADTGNDDVASGAAVLRLRRRGDQVWLQIFYSGQNGLFFDPYWTDSTFTGFLIYADRDFLKGDDQKATNAEDLN
ncbi:unnamed protein product [Arctogadus glacialis]